MKNNYQIYKPFYTSANITEMHYGSDKSTRASILNSTYRKYLCFWLFAICFWIGVVNGLNELGRIDEYMNYLMNIALQAYEYVKTSQLSITTSHSVVFLTVFKLLFMGSLPIILATVVTAYILTEIKRRYQRKGLIFKSWFKDYDDYFYIKGLYEEAEKVLEFLENSDDIHVFIKSDDAVTISKKNGLITMEKTFNFRGLAKRIFRPDVINLSVLDFRLCDFAPKAKKQFIEYAKAEMGYSANEEAEVK